MEMKKVNKEVELTEEVKRYIDFFSSKKRKEAMTVLYPNRKLSHGEYAKAMDTSATSLSNILLNFENFEYLLIDSFSEGKRRYYYLTKLGKEYVESCKKQEKIEEKGKIIRDSFQMLQKAKESLKEFQALEENWEIELEDALIARIECKKIVSDQSQRSVDEFIKFAECALINDYDNQIMNVMKLLQENSILQIRFSRFIEKFDLFRPFLEVWENGLDALQMYELLDAAVLGDKEIHIDMLKDDQEYEKLAEGIRYVAQKSGGKDTAVLYECFNRFLAGNQILSGFLAREVFAVYREKAIIRYEEKKE